MVCGLVLVGFGELWFGVTGFDPLVNVVLNERVDFIQGGRETKTKGCGCSVGFGAVELIAGLVVHDMVRVTVFV